MVSEDTKRLGRKYLLLGILLFISVIFTKTFALFYGGFDTRLVTDFYTIYTSEAIGAGLILFLIMTFLFSIRNKIKEYGTSIFFDSPGENPTFLPLLKKITKLQLVLGSTIVSLILGFFIVLRQQTQLFEVPVLVEQQFTPLTNAVYQVLLVPISENLGHHAFIAVLAIFILYFANKGKWGKQQYLGALAIILVIAGGIFGAASHKLRYGSSDMALISVGFFWGVGTLVTVATGSFIPFLMIHIVNNTILKLQQFYSSDFITASVILLIVGLSIWFASTFIKRKPKKKK